MRLLGVTLIVGWVVGAGVASAAGFERARVSDSAQWALHADLAKLRGTQLGAHLMGKLGEGAVAAKLDAFAAVFGFDPRRDLSAVTLYGKTTNRQDGVALLAGTFDEQRLVTLLRAGSTYQTLTHGPYTIHSWIDEQKPAEGRQYGCIHPSGTLLISHGQAMVQEALDVLDGKRAGLAADRPLSASLPADALFFVAGANVAGLGGADPAAAMLRQAQGGCLALSEAEGQATVSVMVSTRDAQTATNLQALAQGLVAVSQLSAEKAPALARFAQGVRISMEGTTVRALATCPVQQVIAVLQEGERRKAAARGAAAGTGNPP